MFAARPGVHVASVRARTRRTVAVTATASHNYASLSTFLAQVREGAVLRADVSRDGGELFAHGPTLPSFAERVALPQDFDIVERLLGANVDVNVVDSGSSLLGDLDPGDLRQISLVGMDMFVILAAIGLFSTLMSRQSGVPTAHGGLAIGKAAGVTTTFKDVAGIDEVKSELEEIVSILRFPARYTALGAKVPRGVLLEGPPGCGKTLCARAVAGEADVPFFHVCGSDFMDTFVGVGASRVRELFRKAKAAAPCIVFVDEIDAIAQARNPSPSAGGGADERNQTINALLSEMDGFAGNTGVIVLAATNRREVLDAAVVRAGRFDRTINVPMPDVRGREAIMRVHAHEKPLDDDVDVSELARRTPGFSGADLEALANEAAMVAARAGATTIAVRHFEQAMDRVALGPERTGAVITPEAKRILAVHEAGHAVVAALLADFDVVKKVTIIPRGRSGGATHFIPRDDVLHTREYLEKKMMVALGGRVAEEIVYGRDKVTTGASSDLEVVARIARHMVASLGFNKHLGAANWTASRASEGAVDLEVRALVLSTHVRAQRMLASKKDVILRVADALIERETLEQGALVALMQTTSDDPPFFAI